MEFVNENFGRSWHNCLVIKPTIDFTISDHDKISPKP